MICITFHTGDYQIKLFEILELIIEIVNRIKHSGLVFMKIDI